MPNKLKVGLYFYKPTFFKIGKQDLHREFVLIEF